MDRNDLVGLNAFLEVAEQRSFTRAAAHLGVTPSALSHSIRQLEARLGVRLLVRTTRSVAPTQAGESLLVSVGAGFAEINRGLSGLNELRDRPSGRVRINANDHSIETIIWPRLSRFLLDYPDIHVELSAEMGMIDIVAERFDAGVRAGEQVARDMIAIPIGPEMRMAVVAAERYFTGRAKPITPHDLSAHRCIGLRLPTHDGLYVWEFEKAGRELRVRIEACVVFNRPSMMLEAALEGFGLAYVPEDRATDHVRTGRLVRVLDDWCESSPGYHLYYSGRRSHSSAFSLVVEALRYRT